MAPSLWGKSNSFTEAAVLMKKRQENLRKKIDSINTKAGNANFKKRVEKLDLHEWSIVLDDRKLNLKGVLNSEQGVLIKLIFNSLQISEPRKLRVFAVSERMKRKVCLYDKDTRFTHRSSTSQSADAKVVVALWPDGNMACLALTLSYGEIFSACTESPCLPVIPSGVVNELLTVSVIFRDVNGHRPVFHEIFRNIYARNGVFQLAKAESGRRSEFRLTDVPRFALKTPSCNFGFEVIVADVSIFTEAQECVQCFSVFAAIVSSSDDFDADSDGTCLQILACHGSCRIDFRFIRDYEMSDLRLKEAFMTLN